MMAEVRAQESSTQPNAQMTVENAQDFAQTVIKHDMVAPAANPVTIAQQPAATLYPSAVDPSLAKVAQPPTTVIQ